MARTAMVYNKPTLKVATTEAGLTTGTAVECQITSAILTPTPVYQTIPSTGCTGASQSPGLTGWGLVLNWLEDWTVPGGLSAFAFENDGQPVWFELVPNKDDATVGATGNAYAASGGMGGTFGDGSAAATSATWPLLSTPTIDYPPPVVALTADADDELVDA